MVGVDKAQIDTGTVGGGHDLPAAARYPHHHRVEEPVVDDLMARFPQACGQPNGVPVKAVAVLGGGGSLSVTSSRKASRSLPRGENGVRPVSTSNSTTHE